MDFSEALQAPDPMNPPAGAAPMHPSFEDRPGAPDRVFAALDDVAFARQVQAWSSALRRAGSDEAGVLHLHHLTPLNEAARRAAPGVPIVGHLHGTELLMLEAIAAGPPRGWTHARAWARRLRRWAAQADRLVVATPRGAARAERLLGADPQRLVVIPNGVDPERFAPGPADRRALWSRVLLDRPQGWRPGGPAGGWRATAADVERLATDPVFLYVGRFTAVKRLPLLIEAFTRARARRGGQASLVIVGGHPGEWEGEHPAETIDRIGASGVLLAGWHDQAALPEMLRASDVVVLPSVNEAFGQVLVEGMACGRPAIAIDRGGPAEIVRDGATGWLVAGDDAPALEAAILAAARDPEERRRRGRLGRQSVLARYTWGALTRQLADVFDAVTTGAAERPAA